MKITFDIPYPQTKKGKAAFNRRFGLNAYYAGKSWPERKRDAEELHALATLSMRKAGIGRRLVEKPVEIAFYWDDLLDADNHAVMGKAFVDAMKGYILPDDNRRWVVRVSHEFWDGGCIRCEIREEDCSRTAKVMIDWLGECTCSECGDDVDCTKPFCPSCGRRFVGELTKEENDE